MNGSTRQQLYKQNNPQLVGGDKRKKSKSNYFRYALLFLIWASILLSMMMLYLSSFAIQNDTSSARTREGDGFEVSFGNGGDQRIAEPQINDIGIGNNINDEPSNGRSLLNSQASQISQQTQEQQLHQQQIKLLKQKVMSNALSSNKQLNSQLYNPDPTKGKRLLTYKRFGGRLNNQLFQFIVALQHAKVLKRTFVVPDEAREVDWTGMFESMAYDSNNSPTGSNAKDITGDARAFGPHSIWDLSSLNSAYPIDWTSGLSPDWITSTPDHCLLTPKEGMALLNGGPDLWKQWDEKCPDVINLAGNTGLLFCDRQHQFCGDAEAQLEAYEIYSHLKLSEDLMQYIPSKRKEFQGSGYGEMAIHSRRAGEGGYDWELCIKGNAKTCHGHVEKGDRDKYCDVRTMKGNCAIWLDLDYQIKSKSVIKKNERDYRFVLASDGTHDWNIDFGGQFVVANNTEWLGIMDGYAKDVAEKLKGQDGKYLDSVMGVATYAKQKLNRQMDLSRLRGTMDALSATLLDLFSLVDSKYLLGAYYSTLSLNACFFRGPDRMYDSNMCWLLIHPETRQAISPPVEDGVHIDGSAKEMDDLPAALMSDVEHAFVRSNDGNFIAVDRYLIPYAKGTKKAKQVVGVIGDGLVPLTIEKDATGEETIRADFTCSMGNEHDTPATVILIKGDKSYQEHYYERGEKYKTPFSTNGDRFRTMIILCEQINFDKSLSRHPPLILKSNDGEFHISIGSTFARPVGKVLHGNDTGEKVTDGKDLVHCLNPVYGLKDPRWIIEYLEYSKAVGVSHVHVYNIDLHSPDVQKVLQKYRQDGFITRHDWSEKASRGYTTQKTYEHAKWAAQTDCALRSRGVYDYALFSDIDEVALGGAKTGSYPEGHLAPALDACELAKTQNGKIGCSFNSNTVSSVFTQLTDAEESAMRDKLLMERYTRIEASPNCPSNCKCLGNNCKDMTRNFHYGRQKYMINVRDMSVPPRPLWTHAIARDYNEMEKIMEVLPDDVMQVRHYQGHWYVNQNKINEMEEKEAPLPKEIMTTIHININKSLISGIYSNWKKKADQSSTSRGVEWVKPVERPLQYHPKL